MSDVMDRLHQQLANDLAEAILRAKTRADMAGLGPTEAVGIVLAGFTRVLMLARPPHVPRGKWTTMLGDMLKTWIDSGQDGGVA